MYSMLSSLEIRQTICLYTTGHGKKGLLDTHKAGADNPLFYMLRLTLSSILHRETFSPRSLEVFQNSPPDTELSLLIPLNFRTKNRLKNLGKGKLYFLGNGPFVFPSNHLKQMSLLISIAVNN